MPPPHTLDFDQFTAWYHDQARPLVLQLDPSRADEWDADLAWLAREGAKPLPETAVCFLGNAGVGKSTLINALAGGADAVLPSGGVGPLTAQALEVRYAERPSFEATYHPPVQLSRLVSGLRLAFAAELLDATADGVSGTDDSDPSGVADPEGDAAPTQEFGGSRRDELRKQARLLVTGRQDGDAELTYLLTGLRAAIEPGDANFRLLRPEDRERSLRLRRAMDAARQGQRFIVAASATPDEFRGQLHDHAAGFMAPLIQKLHVEYPSELLKAGVTLVDLPGVGVAGDIYRKITTQWVREKARAIVLVVDRSGITEAVADLLRSSEFLNRLMYAATAPAEDAVSLLVAVTRVYDVAAENWRNDRSRSKLDHFRDLRGQLQTQLRQQLQDQLAAVLGPGDRTLSATERLVIGRVVEDVKIHPLSAVEYRKLLLDDEDDRAFVRDAAETGVPPLVDDLRDLAVRRQSMWRCELIKRQTDFVDRVLKTLQATVPATEGVAAELAEEATRLRETFRDFVAEKRQEYNVRLGRFGEFWKGTLPQLVEREVLLARQAATPRMRAYLAQLADAHAATLQAAVNRGGTFHGAKRIDLPHDLALCFDGAVAERWGSPILQAIRDRTWEFAGDCVALVDETVEWARGHNCPQVAERLATQVEALRADALQATVAGLDRTAEIRERINQRLVTAVEVPIRARCQQFREGEFNQGRGVKSRVLALFAELGEEVAEAAGAQALPLLQAAVADTEAAILKHPAFVRHPLDSVDRLATELVAEPTPEARRRMELGRGIAAALRDWTGP